jgi:hypothetical protein
MIVLVDPKDSRTVRNKDNVLALYEMMINQKKSEERTATFVSSGVHPTQPSDSGRFCSIGAVLW